MGAAFVVSDQEFRGLYFFPRLRVWKESSDLYLRELRVSKVVWLS